MFKENHVQWHALYVESRCEKKVAAQLNVLNIETIVPIQKQSRQWSDRKKIVDFLVFPNYVFLASSIGKHEDVLKLKHVVGFVRFGSQIVVISDREFAIIKQIEK